ncbi:MAG: DUF2071 domain-containing protein [Gemmatimonadota bacterium]
MHRPFLTASWRHLLFANYEADRALVQRFVPRGTELDLLDGRALVSIVGFRFLDTRLLGVPVPWHRDFDEVNLRAYARRKVDGRWERGVVFVRELVPRPAIAWTARLAYNEPYRAVPMRHKIAMDAGSGGTLRYEWRQAGAWHAVAGAVRGAPGPIDPDSPTGFITEHYLGYTGQRSGGTVEYRVAHPRWNVWERAEVALQCDVRAVYGPEWCDALGAAPWSAFVCDGAPVTISFPRRLPT